MSLPLDKLITQENQTITKLERAYLRNKRSTTYIALEDLNFVWDTKEIDDFEECWKLGYSIQDLSKLFKRTQEEILVLIMDLGMNRKIKRRKNGLWGDNK